MSEARYARSYTEARSVSKVLSRREVLAIGAASALPLVARAASGALTVPQGGATRAAPTMVGGGASSIFSANQDPFSIRDLLQHELPYVGTFARPLPASDDNGVATREIAGVVYDHPVAQAQRALSLLDGYAHSGDTAYLDMARANADRLIETAVVRNEASFFPYPFEFALHGGPDRLSPPWYSGMAQGQALSAFCRLYRVTADERYVDAAHATFTSFTLPRSLGVPWVANVDAHGYGWYEEYADDLRPDFTFNGHGFAVYGLYDYFALTGDPDAKALFRIGATTMKRYADTIRTPGWVSKYCLRHETQSVSYHKVHIDLLYKLFDMTGDLYFASIADAYLEDFPSPTDYGTGTIAAGSHRFATANASGTVIAVTTAATDASTGVQFGSRRKLKGAEGVWLRVDSGEHSGRWVEEGPAAAYIGGLALARYGFAPRRLVRFEAGTYTGSEFTKGGKTIRSVTSRLRASSAAHCDMRALVNGHVHYRIVNGVWAGLWLPAGPGVRLASDTLTGDVIEHWEDALDEHREGQPAPIAPPRLVRFSQRTHTGIEFSDAWEQVSRKTAGLNAPSSAFADQQVRLQGQTYYRITGGIWKGLWVEASVDVVLAA